MDTRHRMESPYPKPGMTLKKAIEIVGDIIKYQFSASRSDEGDAIKLSLAALNARKIWQDEEGFDPSQALPGETEE